MDPGAPAPHEPESTSPPSPSPSSSDHPPPTPTPTPTPTTTEPSSSSQQQQQHPSRYESQKRRDWNTFLQYLKNHKPPAHPRPLQRGHVIEFLKYLDQFGKTKVHNQGCPYFGQPNPPEPCTCPLKQAWGSLDALIGRLRAAYEESGGKPESNPFGARAVRIYLREVRESQAKARGIPYEKKKRKRTTTTTTAGASSATAGEDQTSSSSASKVAATTTSEGAKNGDGRGDQGDGSGVGTTSDTKLTQTASASASATVNRDSSPTPPAS